MAGLKIDNLSDSLLNYLEGLGLNEEQVQQLIDNISGDLSALQTTDKSSLVAAINELFQNANNGKELIANAIGEPVSADDTFSAMSNDINGLLSTFKTNMMNNGIAVESSDKFKSLIDKIATMVEEGSGKGIQFVRKDITLPKGSKWLQVNDLGFKANIVMYDADTSHVLYNDTAGYDLLVLYPIGGSIGSATYSSVSNFPGGMYINENGFRLPIFTAQYTESNTQTTVNKTITIIAIGVGEEDTTLRDSLASILEDEGVSVTPEDDMANLITKTDEEFDNKNNTINGLEGDMESARNTLAGLMQEGGYDITGEEDIDILLELLTISGISLYDIKQIAYSYDCTFILKNDGSIWACGDNTRGQLGLADTTNRTTFTQVTTNINNDVKELSCGNAHTFIIKNDGSIWSCGLNNYGQLGLGDTTQRTTFTQVTTNINNDIKQVACGGNHTFILKTDGSVWSCGYNGYGQLGLGTNDINAHSAFTQIPKGLY